MALAAVTALAPSASPTLAPWIDDPDVAWSAAAGAADAVIHLDAAVRDELHAHRAMLCGAIPAGGTMLDNDPFPRLRGMAGHLRATRLDRGPGFAVVRGLEPLALSETEMENVFWRLCVAMGEPIVQKGEGIRFGKVANLGLPPDARPRYHETGAGGSIHTDSPIMPRVADIVGLLCLRAAAAGGESKFVSVASVHNILMRHAPGLLAELYAPFHFDRRIDPVQVSADNPAVLCAPIFTYDPRLGPRGLRLRWQPEYVWQAADLPGIAPLRDRQRLALHLLEGLLEDPGGALTVRLAMRPGDMQFLNNATVAHGRTRFVDHGPASDPLRPDPATRREMRRVWLVDPS